MKGYRSKLLITAGFLFLVLVLTKSLGALAVTVLLTPVILFLSTRLQLWIAAAIAALVLLYPMLRAVDLIPTDSILSIANDINPLRARSLDVRLTNEDILLSKARERPTFGWGTYGRNRVFDSTGRDISVTDGYWVIIFGVGGWCLYLATMGLLTVPIIIMALKARRTEYEPATAILAVISSANLIDLIPNAGISPVTWLITGALWGRLAMGRVNAENEITVTEASVDQVPTYARQYTPKVRK